MALSGVSAPKRMKYAPGGLVGLNSKPPRHEILSVPLTGSRPWTASTRTPYSLGPQLLFARAIASLTAAALLARVSHAFRSIALSSCAVSNATQTEGRAGLCGTSADVAADATPQAAISVRSIVARTRQGRTSLFMRSPIFGVQGLIGLIGSAVTARRQPATHRRRTDLLAQ